MKEIEALIEYLKSEYEPALIGALTFEKKEAIFKNYTFNSHLINEWIEKNKIKLYSHQTDALEVLETGKNVLLTTPTASGKSLVYFLYTLDKYAKDPNSCFLYIYPTRALLSDQFNKLKSLSKEIGIRIPLGRFYGDFKSKGNVIFTTPDSLHLHILRNHERWGYFLKNLKLIVVDEIHIYYGLLGSNAALVFKRLRKLLEKYYKNKEYEIVLTSATIPNSIEHAKRLFGKDLEFIEINYSGAPEPKRTILIFNPLNYEDIQFSKNRENPIKFMCDLILDELQYTRFAKILTFMETRRQVENLYIELQEYLFDDDLLNYISPYKATYTKEKRKEIEEMFKFGKLRAIISTNALELGIDIGDLDIVNNYGIPGLGIASLIQRFGRCGRDPKRHALNILVLRQNALDQYYARHIEELKEKIKSKTSEYVIINENNEILLKKHTLCCLWELFKNKEIDTTLFNNYEVKIIEQLIKEGKIKQKGDILGEKYYYLPNQPIYFNLRSIDEEFQIKDENGNIIETLDKYSVFSEALPGLIYISLGKIFRVEEVDFDKKEIKVREIEERLKTNVLSEENVEILNEYYSKYINHIQVIFGKIKIDKIIYGYIEKGSFGQYFSAPIYYEEPYVYTFETEAIWLILPEKIKELEQDIYLDCSRLLLDIDENLFEIAEKLFYKIDYYELYKKYPGRIRNVTEDIISQELIKNNIVPDQEKVFLIRKLIECKYFLDCGLHAIEHGIINILPTTVVIEPREIGGRSFSLHPQTEKPTIFIYEAIPQGIGYSKLIFQNIEKILQKTIENLEKCKCKEGCPNCCYSSKCGNLNEFLEKNFAIKILKKLT